MRFRLVTVTLPAGALAGSEIPIPDQDDLRQAEIEGIETYNATDLTQGPDGVAVVSAADAIRLVVILADQSNDRVRFMPYQTARVSVLAGETRQFDNWIVTWPQCRIRIVQTLAAVTPTQAVIGVHFRYPSDPR
jgi:hypothetical protein